MVLLRAWCHQLCNNVSKNVDRMKKMVRTQIQLTEEQSRNLKRMALGRGLSVAELIRQSVDQYLRSKGELTPEKMRQRALAVIGIASSGVTDLGREHDHYLDEAFVDSDT